MLQIYKISAGIMYNQDLSAHYTANTIVLSMSPITHSLARTMERDIHEHRLDTDKNETRAEGTTVADIVVTPSNGVDLSRARTIIVIHVAESTAAYLRVAKAVRDRDVTALYRESMACHEAIGLAHHGRHDTIMYQPLVGVVCGLKRVIHYMLPHYAAESGGILDIKHCAKKMSRLQDPRLVGIIGQGLAHGITGDHINSWNSAVTQAAILWSEAAAVQNRSTKGWGDISKRLNRLGICRYSEHDVRLLLQYYNGNALQSDLPRAWLRMNELHKVAYASCPGEPVMAQGWCAALAYGRAQSLTNGGVCDLLRNVFWTGDSQEPVMTDYDGATTDHTVRCLIRRRQGDILELECAGMRTYMNRSEYEGSLGTLVQYEAQVTKSGIIYVIAANRVIHNHTPACHVLSILKTNQHKVSNILRSYDAVRTRFAGGANSVTTYRTTGHEARYHAPKEKTRQQLLKRGYRREREHSRRKVDAAVRAKVSEMRLEMSRLERIIQGDTRATQPNVAHYYGDDGRPGVVIEAPSSYYVMAPKPKSGEQGVDPLLLKAQKKLALAALSQKVTNMMRSRQAEECCETETTDLSGQQVTDTSMTVCRIPRRVKETVVTIKHARTMKPCKTLEHRRKPTKRVGVKKPRRDVRRMDWRNTVIERATAVKLRMRSVKRKTSMVLSHKHNHIMMTHTAGWPSMTRRAMSQSNATGAKAYLPCDKAYTGSSLRIGDGDDTSGGRCGQSIEPG